MIRLLEPAWLLALVPVAVLAAVYVWAQFARKRIAVRFANASLLAKLVPKLPGWRRHLPAGLLVIALAVLVGGMTRPAVDVEEPQERATVILAIDVSLSMMSTDVDPTRIDAAKSAASDFVAELPEQYNVGLVSFAGYASVVVPPTKNRAEVTSAINGLTLAEATATGDAVFASLQAVQQVMTDESGQLAPARILLLSDGYRTAGRTVDEAGRPPPRPRSPSPPSRSAPTRASSNSTRRSSRCPSTARPSPGSPRPPAASTTRPSPPSNSAPSTRTWARPWATRPSPRTFRSGSSAPR
nr:hypothetical protein GCM10025732_45650 [Glycomyces mayteni]